MMPMYFFFSKKVVLLFDFWNVNSAAAGMASVLADKHASLHYLSLLVLNIAVMLKSLEHMVDGMVLSVVVIMLLTILYEAIKVGKAKLIQRSVPVVVPSISQETLAETERDRHMGLEQLITTPKKWLLWHVVQTLLHVAQVVIGYLVMLAVMSYNTWIFLGVIAGSAIGYYIAYPLLNAR